MKKYLNTLLRKRERELNFHTEVMQENLSQCSNRERALESIKRNKAEVVLIKEVRKQLNKVK